MTSRVQLVDNSRQQSKPKHRRLLTLKLARKTKNGDKENEANFANRESSVNESYSLTRPYAPKNTQVTLSGEEHRELAIEYLLLCIGPVED